MGVSYKPRLGPDANSVLQDTAVLSDSVAVFLHAEIRMGIWPPEGLWKTPGGVSHKPKGVSRKPHLGPDSNSVLQNSAVLLDYGAIFLRTTCKLEIRKCIWFSGASERPRGASHKPTVVSYKPHQGPDSNAVLQNLVA